MPFVLDASVALAWHFGDENWPGANSIAQQAVQQGVVVPSYFPVEIAGGLLRGERMGRTTQSAISLFMERLMQLRIEFDAVPEVEAWSRVLPLARDQRLRIFDAGYLHLAIGRVLPLATFDTALRAAAEAKRVSLVEVPT